jgi:hypothetical protein
VLAKSAISSISPGHRGEPVSWARKAFDFDAVVTNPQSAQRYNGTAKPFSPKRAVQTC